MRLGLLLLLIFFCGLLKSQQSKTKDFDSSLFYINRGADFYAAGDFIRAETDFKKALYVRETLFGSSHISLAHAYNNLGLVALKTWTFDKSIYLFSQAEKIYLVNNGYEIELAITYSNFGYLYRLIGELNLSELYYNKAIDILKNKNDAEVIRRLSGFYLRYGMLEFQRNNLEKAINYYETAINNFGNIIDHVTLHNLYCNIAEAYINTNKNDSALFYLNKSKVLLSVSNELPERFFTNTYFGFANYYQKTKDYSKAINFLNKCESILNSSEFDSSYFFRLYIEYSNCYRLEKKFEKSIYYNHLALEIITQHKLSDNYITPKASRFIEKVNGISLLKDKSSILISWYKTKGNPDLLKYALESLTVATELIDNARNGYLTFESKLTIAESEASIYKLGIWCAHQLYQKTGDTKYLNNAFYFAEKNKSSILEATLQEEKAKSFAGIPDSLIAKEQKLKRDITFYKDQIYEEQRSVKPDKAKLSIWNNYLFEFTREQEELKNFLEKNYADYFNLKYKSTTVKIESIQDIIDNNTTVIEYSVTDSILYIFEITKESAELFSVAIDSNFFTDISDFLNKFRHFNFIAQGKTTFNDYINLTNSIYTVILAPTDQSGLKENIVIIPDDILSYLPFEAIVCPSEAKTIGSFRDMNYLVLNHTISYSYSSSLMVETHKQKKRKLFNRLVAFAPEYNHFSAAEIALNENRRHNYRNNLAPLPYALEEAQMVCTIARGKGYINRFATENSFVDVAARYDIIHLAMHTIIDDGNPQYSKLVFYSDSVNSDEGLLTTNEIFGLKLNAGLAVLSSCSSGEGEFKKGEGVLSLARGFFYAGCPSLVMTLWKVEDESGLTLMKFFYKYLRKGYSKPKALQKAKIEYLKTVPEEKQNPFYWSAYISIGNPSPLYYPRWTLYLITAGIIFLVYKCVRRIKKGKAKKLREPFA